jgi:predicted amidohydrolase
MGAVICADIEYGRSLLAPLRGKIDLLLYPQASNAPRWLARRIFEREIKRGRPMFADSVAAVGSPAVYAGLVGPVQRTTRFLSSYLIGGTWVVDMHGLALSHVPFDEEGVAVAEVDMAPGPGGVADLHDPGGIGDALMNLLARKLPDLRQPPA